MKYLKYIITAVLLVSITACSVNEDNFPIDLDAVLNNNGAYLRVLSVDEPVYNFVDLPNARYVFTGEVFDLEEGNLLESVEFNVGFRSFERDPVTGQPVLEISENPNPILTVPASEFVRGGGRNLPQVTFTIPLSDVLAALDGVTEADLELGDTFLLRWTVNLTDGRSFSGSDASADITGGAFFNSPYQARVNVAPVLPDDQFVGEYLFEAQNTGFNGWSTYSETFTATLSVNPENTANGRIFTAEPYAQNWGGLNPIDTPIAFSVGTTYDGPSGGTGTGLGCGGGLAIGLAGELAEVDLFDDSQFTLWLADNIRSDCGAGPVDVEFTVTKQ